MGFFSRKKNTEEAAPSPSPQPTQSYNLPPPQANNKSNDDPSRAALFGKAPKNPAPTQNPYANPGSAGQSGYDSYGGGGGYGGNRAGGGYGKNDNAGGAGGYGAGRGGYGAGRDTDSGYAGSTRTNPPSSDYGAGPRPGVDRQNSAGTMDSGRRELFGDARERAEQRQQAGYGQRPDRGDRQLTAEEEEEEDVEAIKQEIRFVKQESVASTRNALRAAAAAEESGRDSLARLGAQGERIFNTEKNLDLAENSNRAAEENVREIKSLNRSMFAVHVKNPFNSTQRQKARDEAILERHELERATRDATRQFGYESKQHVSTALNNTQGGYGRSQRSMADRAKYQFEADDSDEEKEREIEDNLDQIGAVTSRLRGLAVATGQELDRQNKQINNIMNKSDKVHTQVHLNTERMKRIK